MPGFFDHESAILARLRNRIADVHIMTLREIEDLRTYRGPAPALAVGYDSGDVDRARTSGRTAHIDQSWLVVAIARNVAGDSDAEARAVIETVVNQALAALMGFRYSDVGHLMTLTALPDAIYAAGYMLVPLVFGTEKKIVQQMT